MNELKKLNQLNNEQDKKLTEGKQYNHDGYGLLYQSSWIVHYKPRAH